VRFVVLCIHIISENNRYGASNVLGRIHWLSLVNELKALSYVGFTTVYGSSVSKRLQMGRVTSRREDNITITLKERNSIIPTAANVPDIQYW
jgi:hypothetical protein